MTAPALDIQASPSLWQWLADHNVSLAMTTYQTNRLFFIGRKEEPGRLALHERLFDKPMGLCWRDDTLTMACRYQIWQLANRLPSGHRHQGGDRLYVPRQSWITGDVNAHEVAIDHDGRLLFINTDFSCLATLGPDHSFVPLWKPPFIGKLVAEDRCHLNGMALRDGEVAYVTACSGSDEAAGWRNHRRDGGMVLHVPTNEIAATGLSMPHSPRWYRNRLWVLNSGSGEFGHIDGGQFRPVCYCPGFVRGLAFWEDFAVLGLSQLRSSSFTGLALEERLAADNQTAQCGLAVIDLRTGALAHWLRFGNVIEELFDVVILPGCRQPRALGLQDDAIERLVTFPGHDGLMTTKPTVKRHSKGTTPPVAGLPRALWDAPGATPTPALDGPVLYQRVFHLTPDNLRPYDAMTWPHLSQRWATQPPRGELIGFSASIQGELVGMLIAERHADAEGKPAVEVISLFVLPACRKRGIAGRLLTRLREAMPEYIFHQD